MLLVIAMFGLPALVAVAIVLALLSRRSRDWRWLWPMAIAGPLEILMLWGGMAQHKYEQPVRVTAADAVGTWTSHRGGGSDEIELAADGGFTRRKTVNDRSEVQTGQWTLFDPGAPRPTGIDILGLRPVCLPSEQPKPGAVPRDLNPFCGYDMVGGGWQHGRDRPVLTFGADDSLREFFRR